jgi:hypothetical protein
LEFAQDFNSGVTNVSFDLVNSGNSAATEIRESGQMVPFDASKSDFENLFPSISIPAIDPAGFSLGKDEHRHFEMNATGWIQMRNAPQSRNWSEWRRFTYQNIFGKVESVCIAARGSKYGIFQIPSPSVPPKFPHRNR